MGDKNSFQGKDVETMMEEMGLKKEGKSFQLNLAEQQGLVTLMNARENAIKQANDFMRRIEEAQMSILQSRGHDPSAEKWNFDLSTWTYTQELPDLASDEPDAKELSETIVKAKQLLPDDEPVAPKDEASEPKDKDK